MQAPWWWSRTEMCGSNINVYFNVNFNVFFKLIKVHLLVSELYMHYKCLPLHEFASISVYLQLFTPVYTVFTCLSYPHIHAWKLEWLRYVNTTVMSTCDFTGVTWMTATQQWAKVTFSFSSAPYFIITFSLTHFPISA